MTVQRHKEGKKNPLGAMLLSVKPLLPLPSPNPLRMSPLLLSAQVHQPGERILWASAMKTCTTSTQSPFQSQPWGGDLLLSQRQVLCPHPNVWAFLSVPFKGSKRRGGGGNRRKKTQHNILKSLGCWQSNRGVVGT